jgi:hypothetical protein
MEKEINHRGDQVNGERKSEHTPYSPPATPLKRDDVKQQEPFKRKRIRAYQRIDYWQ